MTRIILTIILVLISSVLYPQTTITILHTNNINGNFENCLCSDHPLGSLEKIKVIVDEMREKDPNIIFVDAGDFFSPFGDSERDEYMYQIAELLNYDAMAIGDQAFSNGVNFFLENQNKYKLPFLSANLKIDGQKYWPPFITKKYNSLNVLVISIFSQDAFQYYAEEKIRGLKVSDIVTTVNEIIEYNPADYTILISHNGFENDKKLLESLNNVNLIIGAHTQDVLDNPVKINNSWITQAGSDGFYLGKILLEFGQNNQLLKFDSEYIPIKLELPNDPEIVEIIQKYYYQKNKKILAKGGYFKPIEEKYVIKNASACSTCHELEYKNWTKSFHSQSFESIKNAGKSKILKCISCHVTGFGKKDGYINTNISPGLDKICCTECHYLNIEHLTRPAEVQPLTVTEEKCIRCHDLDNDPDFNFSDDFSKIKHVSKSGKIID